MQILDPDAWKTPAYQEGAHVHAATCTESPLTHAKEIKSIAAAEVAARKALAEAEAIKKVLTERHNDYTNLVIAVKDTARQIQTANWSVSEAEADFARTLDRLDAIAGDYSSGARALWDACRVAACESEGVRLVKAAAAKVPARHEAALAEIKTFIAAHGIDRSLWPVELLGG